MNLSYWICCCNNFGKKRSNAKAARKVCSSTIREIKYYETISEQIILACLSPRLYDTLAIIHSSNKPLQLKGPSDRTPFTCKPSLFHNL